ncbi:MAG: hypothetical protein LBK02_07855 [Treponema sp.]|nr:hypothetical protein [Treponema sp.]
MSIRVRAKIHPFRDEYKDFHCEAAPLSEIFAGLNSPLGIAQARFLIGDEMVTDTGRTPPDGSAVYINVVPEGTGDQMKDTGKGAFWAGLGLMAIGVVISIVSWGTLGPLGMGLIGSGIGLMAGGAVLLNTEIPTPSSRETGDQMESVRGSKNQARKLGYIPVLFGRHLITPDVAALPYTEIDSNGEQWLTQLFCAGYNDMTVELNSFKVGDTALTDLSETKSISAILAGTDARVKMELLQNGEASALYPKTCVEQQFNKILKNKEKDKEDKEFPAPVVFTTADKTTRINVDIMFPQGLVKYNDDNNKETASVSVSIQYKPDGAPDSPYVNFPGWNQAISDKTVDMFRLQASVSGLSPGKYTVKIARITEDSTDSKTIDAVYTGSVRAFAGDRPVREAAAKNLTLIALKIKATALANGVIDNFNFVAQSNIPDYSSGAWTRRLTKNPAAMLLYALQGKINPVPVADADIDWDSLKEFWTFCNDKNYTCNAVQGDRELFSVLCAKIAKTGRASVLRVNGKFSVVIDRKRPAPVQLFSPRNTTGYHQTIIKADVPDEIALEFIDETRGWASNERSVYNTPDGLSAGTEKTKQASSVWGITDPATVFKFARYQYACITNRPFIHTLECDIEYLLCKKGDLIEYAGDTALAGVAYGKITGVILYEGAAIGITADTVFPQEPGKSYGIRCRKSGGQLITLNVLNRETADKDLRFETPQAAGILEEGDLVIFGIAGQITRRLVVTEIAPVDNFRAALTCVDYSPEIFGVDDPGYVVPPFDNKITTSGSVTDSGIVNTAEWQTWFTYHDSSLMPERPAGGGTTGGWHRYRTPESRWVSLKTAKSIADGEWGIPSQTSFLVDEELRGLIAGTADVGRPDAITGLTAAAGKDAVHITWNPLGNGLANAVKHIRIEIKKTAGGDWQTFEVRGGDFVYNFNRATDGYPEKSDLAAWRIRAKAVSIYGRESVEYAPDAGGLAIDTSGYGTWLPVPPALVIATSGRTINVAAPPQTWYGAAGCEFQISKPVAGTPWYAPAMADTDTVYSVADSWKGAEGGVYAAAAQITQQLPLEGQDANTPKDTAYKYRARSLTRAYDGSVLYRSAWSAEAAAIAKGTGVRDVVAEAIGEAQLKNGAVTNGKIEDATIDYEKFNPAVKPPRKVTALPANPYTGYIRGDTVILLSGGGANDEKLYRLVNPAAAGTAGWSSAVDGADLIDETIAAAKMAAGVRPTRTVSALPSLSDTNYKPGDTVVLLGDSKVYRRTETGWIKTLDGADILANTIQASSLNVLAKNVINSFVGGTSEGWTLGPGCSLVDDAAAGFKVLQLADDTAGTIKIHARSNQFEVLPDDIFIVKFGIECLTDGTSEDRGLYMGIGPEFSNINYKIRSFNTETKKWQIGSASTNNPYFLIDYNITARNHYTTYILGKDVNIRDVPAPEYTSDAFNVRCIQLLTTTTCQFRDGINEPSAPRAFKLICPQIYRMGGGRVIAENIEAHSITANEIMAKTLTANEVALHTLTGDLMAMNTITTKSLAVGDFTNLATVNENIPASMLPQGSVFGQTLIDGGYIVKADAGNEFLMFTDFPEGILQAGDEYYFEFSAKAAAATGGYLGAWGYSAINRVDGVVVDATSAAVYISENLAIATSEQRFTGAIKITSTMASVKYILFGFENAGTKQQVYFKNVIIRKKNAGEMIVDGSIETNHMKANSIEGDRIKVKSLTGDRLEANTVSAENLNVLAKNVINPFINGTKEGWDTEAPVVNIGGLGYVLMPSEVPGKDFQSNGFTVLPDDIYRLTFGIESLVELGGSRGLYIGLSRERTFNVFEYSFTDNKWLLSSTRSNAYFLQDYRTAARKYYTTYILGSRVTISDVPAPVVTDTAYQIFCLQLTGTDTACRIRSGYNDNQPPDAAWYFIQPQVYRTGSSKITAENIITSILSAISASLGRMTGDGNPNDSQYKLVLSDGFSGNENKKGTFLLGAATDSAYLRRWWDGNVWHMAIKLATFIVDSIASNIFGRFRVFRTGQNSDTDPPVLDTNPGADPQGQAVNHASSDFRGAFRVRKSNNPLFPGYNDTVFEALPNGTTRIENLQHLYNDIVYRNYYRIDASALDSTKFYLVSFGGFDHELDCEIHSPNFVAAEPYNQNRIRFLLTIEGWGDTGASLAVLSYNRYAPGEVTIGAIVAGNMGGEKGIYIRGGFVYSFKCNGIPVLRTSSYAYNLQGYTEVYNAGVAIDNWAGTNISTLWTYNDGGPLFMEALKNLKVEGGASTSPGTGALTVAGGVGIAGALNVGGTASFWRISGDILELYQGGVMIARIKLGMAAGALSLLIGGLPISCEGISSSGDIKGETTDTSTSWTAAGNTAGVTTIMGMAYGNGRFVVVGGYGKAAYSTDGITWTAVGDTKFGTSQIWGITYDDGKFIAVGSDGKASYSPDGITWTAVGDTKFDVTTITGIAYGNGKFIAVGAYGKAAYSTDGITWTAVNNTAFGANGIYTIIYGGGKFLAVDNNNKMAYSIDGITWTTVSDTKFGTNIINAITYGGGKFMAVGSNGKAAYSTDGAIWTAAGDTKFGSITIYTIIYGGGTFIAAGNTGKASYSTDGITWTAVSDTKFGTNTINAIAYGAGRFVAVGTNSAAYWATIIAKLVFNANGSVSWARA